ncbi:MAG: AraC family transcriptional regulator [Kiritimatiellae bacterium]|nr:AraC family transcriptional regulator [Kiritimatiellia bacterium]
MKTTFKSYSSSGALLFQVFKISGKKSSQSLNHGTTVALQFIIKGEGKYFVNYRCYDFRRNSLLLSRPNDNHRCMPNSGCYMDKLCLLFPSGMIGVFLPMSVYRSLPYVIYLSTKEAVRVRQLMQEISDGIKNKPVYWYKKMLAEIWTLIIILYRSGQRRVDTPDPHPALKQALAFIEKNFRSDINIQSLCKKLDMSVGRLSHIFQDEIGMGIRHYIIQRRVAEAKLLLNSRHLEVRAIAREVGYLDNRLFLHEFKLLTTMTPEEYRSALFDEKSDQRITI